MTQFQNLIQQHKKCNDSFRYWCFIKEVSKLSSRLLEITSLSQIEPRYYEWLKTLTWCKKLLNLKRPYWFQRNNFKNVDSFEDCTVVNCKSCNLGKWVIACETENRGLQIQMNGQN